MKKSDDERKKKVEQISKHIHPHDDEPDPTAYMGNYNFPQMLFAFCVGFCTMFVLAVDEINDFKAALYLSILMNLILKPLTDPNGVTWSIVLTLLFLLFMVSVYIINIMKYAYRELEDGSDDTPKS